MITKHIIENIEEGVSLKLISQAYTEIASSKLKRIRQAVEKNRYYLEDLSKVFRIVKQVAANKQLPSLKNNQTISVLLTSNYHFYGNINDALIRFFLEAMKNAPTQQIIVGKTAQEYFKAIGYKQPHQEYLLKTDYPTPLELETLVNMTKSYSKIMVYYAQMQTVMVQTPTAKDITQTSDMKPLTPEEQKHPQAFISKGEKAPAFIFEPEIGKILDFFETQVTNLLLEQTFLESEVSRTASRLISMDQAQSRADKFISQQKILLGQARKSIANNKLLETYNALVSLKSADYDQI